MNILVCIKQVPDTTEIKIDPVTNTLVRDGVPSIINPFDGYLAMIDGALGSPRVFGNTLAKMITLCLTGLAMTVAAKAGMFNVGGEGQLFLGGLAATMTGICLQGASPLIAVPAAFLSAALAGGIYAFIPAVLKVRLKVNEVITTIMLNSVAIYV